MLDQARVKHKLVPGMRATVARSLPGERNPPIRLDSRGYTPQLSTDSQRRHPRVVDIANICAAVACAAVAVRLCSAARTTAIIGAAVAIATVAGVNGQHGGQVRLQLIHQVAVLERSLLRSFRSAILLQLCQRLCGVTGMQQQYPCIPALLGMAIPEDRG